MTVMTASEAYEAILEHHERLGEELAARADAVSGAVADGQPYGAAVAGLVAYLAEEVLPHAAAEEKTIYPAATRAGLAGMVEEMLVEHVTLSALGARVASLTDGKAAAEQAQQVARLFTAHAAKENNLLLPALLADTSVDLAGLLARMHGGTGHDELPAPGLRKPEEDAQATLVSLLLQAAAALARGGEADRACKIAASAWAALRDDRPDLAAKVTAALHGLARRVAEGPARRRAGRGRTTGGTRCWTSATWRRRDGMRRSSAPTGAWRRERGSCLSTTTTPSRSATSSRPSTPGSSPGSTWRAGQRSGGCGSAARLRPRDARGRTDTPGDAAEEPDLDVRQVGHAQRHGLIFTAYRALRPGAGFVLVNDHDPRPLRYQFEAQYPGEFTWDYLEAGPKAVAGADRPRRRLNLMHGEYRPPGGKLVAADVEVAGGRLARVRVSGDFFPEPDDALDRVNAALTGIPAVAAIAAITVPGQGRARRRRRAGRVHRRSGGDRGPARPHPGHQLARPRLAVHLRGAPGSRAAHGAR